VGLELGQVDDDVGAEDGRGDAVLMSAAGVARARGGAVTSVKAEPVDLNVGVFEAALVREVDDMVAEGVAGQGEALQDAEVEGATEAADVVQGETGSEVEVAQVDEVDVVTALLQVVDEALDAEGLDDFVDLAALDGRVDDANAAARPGG